MEPRVYLSINREGYKNLEPIGIVGANKNLDEESENTIVEIEDISLIDSEVEFKDGTLTLYGSMEKEGTNLGWIDTKFDIDLDTATEIVNYFMKKLGKLKTVLESTK